MWNSDSKIIILCSLNKKLINLRREINWFEYFPTAANNPECNSIIRTTAISLDLDQVVRRYPFKLGEDFIWFSKKIKTGMFGLGAGKDTPSLHNKYYDFPDELNPTGLNMFKSMITNILNS
jgi:metal-dependent amidase/aminoacylase/carboxypeptidase family protein